ncbi:MAG: SDR family oxidoreductase [bacterium]|nr:SDR family oxidoreductase [bacterium]
MSNEFIGKTALVTGASRGIGAATAVALAQRGVGRVLLHYNSFRPGVEEVAAAVGEAGAESETFQADLGQVSGIETLLEALGNRAATIDILINNAGSLLKRAPLSDCDSDLYDRVMNLNVKSVWMITQRVAPGMIERGDGVIVNLSSIAARNGGGPGATVYAAAKAAVAAMTKGVAKELAPKGIRVNALSPGVVDNYFHEQFSTREMLDKMVAMTPQGRLSTNEEMADGILFLCSDASRNVIGQTIEFNGGMFMV